MFRNVGTHQAGKVYLVGAGPGDPDLLTVKAVRTLGFADVVLHDALVSANVLALVRPQARVMNVGKRCGQKGSTQDEINDLLVRFAAAGEVVIHLSRPPSGPLIAGGRPADFEWDEKNSVVRLPIPAGKGALNRVRIGLATEPPDTAQPERSRGSIEFDLVLLADAFACGGKNVLGLGGWVLLEADIAARLSPAAKIEGERHEAALGHLAGIKARHLLFDRCPRAGDQHAGAFLTGPEVGRQVERAGECRSFILEGDRSRLDIGGKGARSLFDA